jgi:hypothetical protein
MDSQFIVLGIGADPRISEGSEARLTPGLERVPLVLTYREQGSDDFGALTAVLDFLDVIDSLF